MFLPFVLPILPYSTVFAPSFMFLAFTTLCFYRSFCPSSRTAPFLPPLLCFSVHNSMLLPFVLPTIPPNTVHNSVFLPFVRPPLCTAPFTSRKNTFTFYYSPFVCPPFPSTPFTVHRSISLAFTLLCFSVHNSMFLAFMTLCF